MVAKAVTAVEAEEVADDNGATAVRERLVATPSACGRGAPPPSATPPDAGTSAERHALQERRWKESGRRLRSRAAVATVLDDSAAALSPSWLTSAATNAGAGGLLTIKDGADWWAADREKSPSNGTADDGRLREGTAAGDAGSGTTEGGGPGEAACRGE